MIWGRCDMRERLKTMLFRGEDFTPLGYVVLTLGNGLLVAITTWAAKRLYGEQAGEVTWRPVTSIPLADTDGNPDTAPEPSWLPLINTPSHPEYPAGHPSLNGAAAAVLLLHFQDEQTFTLTTAGLPSRTYHSISQARSDGNNARVWGGMHYPSTVEISSANGEAIATHIDHNFLQRVRDR